MPKKTLSPLEYAILGLLARGPATGYGVRNVFRTTALGRYSDSPGSIYPAIQRLRSRRLIRGHDRHAARRQTDFTLTAAGMRALRAWVECPVGAEDLFRDSSVVDLRLAFVSDVAPRRLPSFLAEYHGAAVAVATRLTGARPEVTKQMSRSAVLAFEVGLTLARARVSWARTASGELAA